MPEAAQVWSGLEFRKPTMLRLIESLTEQEMVYRPVPERNSVAWQLWHIAEVEDNWVRDKLLAETKRYPFGLSVRDACDADYPSMNSLCSYFGEVRGLSRQRLVRLSGEDFDRNLCDEHFGELTVRELWAGLVTSFAWHAGQIALTVGMLRSARSA